MKTKTRRISWLGALLLSFSWAHAELCDIDLNPQKAKEILLQYVARPVSRRGLEGTPLEVSAYFRNWKAGLAKQLGVNPIRIHGAFKHGLGQEPRRRTA